MGALRLLGAEAGARTLVLVTDGETTSNRLTSVDVVLAAAEHAVVVHVISVAFDRELEQAEGGFILVRPNEALRAVAEGTGGQFIFQGEARVYRVLREPSPFSDSHRMQRARWTDLGEPLRDLFERLEAEAEPSKPR